MTKRFLCLCFTTILLFVPILTASALSIDEYNNLSDEQRKWYNEGNEDGFESGYEVGYDECVNGEDGYEAGYEAGYDEGYYQKEIEYESEQESNEVEEKEKTIWSYVWVAAIIVYAILIPVFINRAKDILNYNIPEMNYDEKEKLEDDIQHYFSRYRLLDNSDITFKIIALFFMGIVGILLSKFVFERELIFSFIIVATALYSIQMHEDKVISVKHFYAVKRERDNIMYRINDYNEEDYIHINPDDFFIPDLFSVKAKYYQYFLCGIALIFITVVFK